MVLATSMGACAEIMPCIRCTNLQQHFACPVTGIHPQCAWKCNAPYDTFMWALVSSFLFQMLLSLGVAQVHVQVPGMRPCKPNINKLTDRSARSKCSTTAAAVISKCYATNMIHDRTGLGYQGEHSISESSTGKVDQKRLFHQASELGHPEAGQDLCAQKQQFTVPYSCAAAQCRHKVMLISTSKKLEISTLERHT